MSKENKLTINPRRIIWCCAQVGEEVEAVLKKVGIPASTSPDQVTYRQLRKIADYFERGLFFFIDETEPREDLVDSVHFRNLVKQKKLDRVAQNLIRRVERHRQIYIFLVEDLEDEEIPDLNRYDDIDDAACEVRELLGIDESIAKNDKIEFCDYRHAVEQLGVFVMLSSRYSGEWHLKDLKEETPLVGLSINYDQLPAILVKCDSSEKRQVFTLMHELGHLLLHKTDKLDGYTDIYGAGNEEKEEFEANQFAAKVLISDAAAEKALRCIQPVIEDVALYDEKLKEMSDRSQVSTEVYIRRLADAELIQKQKYDEYRNCSKGHHISEHRKKSGLGRDIKRETKAIFGENYVQAVLASYSDELITLSKASDYLGDMQVKDFLALR